MEKKAQEKKVLNSKAPVAMHKSEKIQAWGYEMSQETNEKQPNNKELVLWITFFVLLVAVLFFSQRNLLSKLFPVQKHLQFHLTVEVLRKPQSDANLHVAKMPNIQQKEVENTAEKEDGLLQQFDQLLRLDSDDAGVVTEGEEVMRDVRLFFVKVEEDGQLKLTGGLYKVPFDKAPLSQTLEKLLKGPETQEINKGLHSMLPPDMQILRIRVVGDTVFLDLSEEFYSLSQLPAVLLAAVEQLVFTVTEFPAVKSLRLLVEGQPIFPESLPASTLEYLFQQNIDLNSDLKREDLWQE